MVAPSSEKLLVQTFDALVDSRRTALSFAREAELTTRFTKYYIRTLFKLSESDFNLLLKSHEKLHEKARHFEQRGKSPLPVLQQAIEKGDLLGRILARHSHHFGALDCILDARATAALVHHLTRLPAAATLPKCVTGAEFGAGTGILSIAGTIPFLAADRKVTVFAFEQEEESIRLATMIQDILLSESRFGLHLSLHIAREDITAAAPYQYVQQQQQEHGPLALWISETFGYQTHPPMIAADCSTFTLGRPTGVSGYSSHLEEIYDPFPKVFRHSYENFDSFLPRIRDGFIAAFPDIVTPRVILDGQESRLLGTDGIWRGLHEIGEPYRWLPKGAGTRWALETTAKTTPSKHSPRQQKKKRRP